MKLRYYKETDSLYIDLSEYERSESIEVADGVVPDYDAAGNLMGTDIDNASSKVALDKLIVDSMPGKVVTDAA